MQGFGGADPSRTGVNLARTALQLGGQRLTGGDRATDGRERVFGQVGVEQSGDEARTGEEQRRLIATDEIDDVTRRRRARFQDGRAAGGEGKRE